MNARTSWWNIGLLIAGLALPVAAMGCGDDDDGDGASGSGGSSTAGKGGSSATAGKGGSSATAGKGGGGGSGGAAGAPAVTPAQCKVATKAVFTAGNSPLKPACADCICDENAKQVSACNAKAQSCWGLIGCVQAACPVQSEQLACVSEGGACFSFAAGVTPASPVGALLRGTECSAACAVEAGDVDAGAGDDAGTP